jgi:polynucleotide 5'-triphosphatase
MLSSLPPALTQHAGFRSARLRVTYDQKTNQILAKIIKVRIADMSIHLPKQPLDCRISVNFEMKFDGDIDAIMAQSQNDRSNDRSKDRLSYTQGLYQVDLTQVTKSRMHNVSRTLPSLSSCMSPRTDNVQGHGIR